MVAQVNDLLDCLYYHVDWKKAEFLVNSDENLQRDYLPLLMAEKGDYRDWHMLRVLAQNSFDLSCTQKIPSFSDRVQTRWLPRLVASVYQFFANGPSWPRTILEKEVVHCLVAELIREAANPLGMDGATAEMWLGWCYENGFGIEHSDARASQLYKQAASRGHVRAMHWFAKHTYPDKDTSQDLDWTRQAALQGFLFLVFESTVIVCHADVFRKQVSLQHRTDLATSATTQDVTIGNGIVVPLSKIFRWRCTTCPCRI